LAGDGVGTPGYERRLKGWPGEGSRGTRGFMDDFPILGRLESLAPTRAIDAQTGADSNSGQRRRSRKDRAAIEDGEPVEGEEKSPDHQLDELA
jgi:hypothetical protein